MSESREYFAHKGWGAQKVGARLQCGEFYLSTRQLFTKQCVPGTFFTLGIQP